MADIPTAGMPNFDTVKWGKGKKLPNQSGMVVQFHGFDDLEEALGKALLCTPKAMEAGLLELGLFGERETKLRTPVRYGVLRASIGHFEPGSIKAVPGAHEKPSSADAVFEVVVVPAGECSVLWGTNVEYAPWIEWGFTMHTRRPVFFPGVGFRMVNPFSYRGAHMFELGLERAADAIPTIMEFWAAKALTSGGLVPL